MIFRLILDALLLFVIVHGWWFIALPIALIGLLNYKWHFETLIAGLAYDSLFGLIPDEGVSAYLGIIVSVALFATMVSLKRILRK